jgi:hypothetical protein
MAEAERRPGKTPLLKQTEIEEHDDEERCRADTNDSGGDVHADKSHNACIAQESKRELGKCVLGFAPRINMALVCFPN